MRMALVTSGEKKKPRTDGGRFFTNLFEKAKHDDRASTLDIPATIARLNTELLNSRKLMGLMYG